MPLGRKISKLRIWHFSWHYGTFLDDLSLFLSDCFIWKIFRERRGKQLPWRAARWPGGAAIGSSLAPSGGGEAQRKISSNHMGTEFLWLRDKCLTSESWQEMMAINCFNARYITNVYSVYNVIKNKKIKNLKMLFFDL